MGATKRSRLIRQTRQTTEYSCGACALQRVLGFWGREVDEAEMMQRLGTTPEEGTYPEEIVRVARELGFEAELRENLTVDEVEQARTGLRSTRCSRRSRALRGTPARKPRPAPSWPSARRVPISASPPRSCGALPTSFLQGTWLRPGLELASPEDVRLPRCVTTVEQVIALIREHQARWLAEHSQAVAR